MRALYATHQSINESVLISLIAGRNNMSTPQEARNDTPGAWKKPFDETQDITRKIKNPNRSRAAGYLPQF